MGARGAPMSPAGRPGRPAWPGAATSMREAPAPKRGQRGVRPQGRPSPAPSGQAVAPMATGASSPPLAPAARDASAGGPCAPSWARRSPSHARPRGGAATAPAEARSQRRRTTCRATGGAGTAPGQVPLTGSGPPMSPGLASPRAGPPPAGRGPPRRHAACLAHLDPAGCPDGRLVASGGSRAARAGPAPRHPRRPGTPLPPARPDGHLRRAGPCQVEVAQGPRP